MDFPYYIFVFSARDDPIYKVRLDQLYAFRLKGFPDAARTGREFDNAVAHVTWL